MNLNLTLQTISEKEQQKQHIQELLQEKYKTKYKALTLLLEYIEENYLNKNQDCMILVTGFKGKGKSSLSIRALLKYKKKHPELFLTGIKQTIKEHIIFESDPLLLKKKIIEMPNKSILILDEGARFLLSEDWGLREHKGLKKVFAEVRPKNHLYIINCPFKIIDIDKKYVGSLCEFWIHIFDWDKAICFRRNANPSRLNYNLEFFEKKWKFINNQLTTAEWKRLKNNIARSQENYFTTLKWGRIPPPIYDKYEKIRNINVFGDLQKAEELQKEQQLLQQKKEEMLKKKIELELAKIESKKKEFNDKIENLKSGTKQKSKQLNPVLESIFQSIQNQEQIIPPSIPNDAYNPNKPQELEIKEEIEEPENKEQQESNNT